MRKHCVILSLLLTTAFLFSSCGTPVSTQPSRGKSTEAYVSEYKQASGKNSDTLASEFKLTRERKPKLFNIVMVGDMLLHDDVERAARDSYGNYDFNFLFRGTGERIRNADIAIVNQEVILAGTELGITGYPSFNAPYEVADALNNAGFDIICHATNHALDRNGRGIRNCLSYWRENYPNMLIAGIHDSAEDQNYFPVIERCGIKIALLNYTYGTNGIAPDWDMPWSVEYLNRDKVKADLDRAEAVADFTIVVPHWGTEYNRGIDQSQREWAQFFADNGADLIMGAHPHVIEPVETVINNEGNQVPVYYSLGNFVSWSTSDRLYGGMADVTVAVQQQNDGTKKVYVDSYAVHPVITYLQPGHEGVSVDFLPDGGDPPCEAICNEVWGSFWTR